MPSRYSRQQNQAAQVRFQYNTVSDYQYDLESWYNRHDRATLISDMSIKKLERAISYVERGFTCYGQSSKVISLRKKLEEKQNV